MHITELNGLRRVRLRRPLSYRHFGLKLRSGYSSDPVGSYMDPDIFDVFLYEIGRSHIRTFRLLENPQNNTSYSFAVPRYSKSTPAGIIHFVLVFLPGRSP